MKKLFFVLTSTLFMSLSLSLSIVGIAADHSTKMKSINVIASALRIDSIFSNLKIDMKMIKKDF